VVLRIARGRERQASTSVQFANLMGIDGKAAKMLLLKH